MLSMTDRELLEQYVKIGSQDAFALLVGRHVDVVYSAARRQTKGDAALAEEVTQQVFILLAQKAKSLPPGVLLGGWLFNSVRFIARDVVRKEQRRALHEQKAAQMAQERAAQTPHNASWKDAEDVLDEAMAGLDEPSRGLLVLKFFEGKTAREVGEALGITEEAARKRVSRAVDELRDLFARRGVVMSSAVLADSLIANAVMQAPAHLAASAATAATAATGATAVATGSGAALLTAGPAKIAAVVLASIVAVGGGVQAVRHYAPKPRQITITPARPIISGTIKNPDGQPAGRAEILIGTPRQSVSVYGRPPRNARTAADAIGKYSIEPPEGHFVLVVRNDAGYAEKSAKELATSPDIQLQPWGKIEGVVMAAGKPVPNVMVNMWAARGPEFSELDGVYHETSVRADGNGKFLFPRVAPGEIWLADKDANNNRSLRQSYVVVEPGKTAHAMIGGSGRAIVGKFIAPPTTQPIWTLRPGPYYYDADLRPWPYDRLATTRPAHQKGETLSRYRELEEAFGRTAEGQKFKSWMFGWGFVVQPDGSFRIDDVPPGTYSLTCNNMELLRELNHLDNWANARREITVPEGARDEVVDLGEIKLDVIPRLKPGEDALPFEMVMLDGTKKNITDFRGKHVLLVSWHSQGDQESIAAYREVQKKWQGDPRLEVIWLGIEPEDSVREAAKKLGLSGKVAAQWPNHLPQEYGASATSAILIDADGKFVQRHLHREIVNKYLNKTIGNPPAAAKAQGPQPTAPVLQTVP
jgi:RNA polymerase sigma factor (sigma-70 family)